MPRLIVNADDFGLTPGVNQAVVDLHVAGALTSATLMAAAPFFAQAATLAQQHPTLGVGCHVVLLDGVPLSPPEKISTLLDRDVSLPAFRSTLGNFVRDLLLRRVDPQHIYTEAVAQIRHLQTHGIPVTHVDTHKHTHMFPQVLEPVLRAAWDCGVRAIRNPFEPRWCTHSTPGASTLRRIEVHTLHTLRSRFVKQTHQQGLATTDGSLGVLATGTLDATAIRAILKNLPEGTWELVCHPAYVDAELRAAHTRLIESRQVEIDALLETLSPIPTSSIAPVIAKLSQIHFGELLSSINAG